MFEETMNIIDKVPIDKYEKFLSNVLLSWFMKLVFSANPIKTAK